MKALSVPLVAHYALPERTVANFWRVTRTDGEVFGFTDHDLPKIIENVVYEAFSGFTASQLATNAMLSVDNMEVTGLLDSTGITEAELEAGLWDSAEFLIFEQNYLDLSMAPNVMLTGTLGTVKRERGLFVAELRSLTAPLQKTVGDLITPNCRYVLGDADCKVDLDALTEHDVPVTAVTSRRVLVASSLAGSSPTYPAGWFSWGVLMFTTGANAGLPGGDIKIYSVDGTIELQLPFPYAVEVGDEFSISPGCNKMLKTGVNEYLGDCKIKFDNVVNNGSESEVPLPSRSFRLPGG